MEVMYTLAVPAMPTAEPGASACKLTPVLVPARAEDSGKAKSRPPPPTRLKPPVPAEATKEVGDPTLTKPALEATREVPP